MIKDDQVVLTRMELIQTQGDRVGFDLRLPEEVVKVTAIQIEAIASPDVWNAWQSSSWCDSQAGHISLKWPLPGGIFFQSPVKAVQSYDNDHFPLGIDPPEGTGFMPDEITKDMRQMQPVDTDIPGSVRLIEVYYKDQMNEALGLDSTYPILLTLYCQTR